MNRRLLLFIGCLFAVGFLLVGTTTSPSSMVGQTAPLFVTRTLDDQPLNLADYRGRFVLLEFWATWCSPCRGETPHLQAVYRAFGQDARFVMIGLSLDQNVAQPKRYVRKHGLKWVQGFLPAGSDTPEAYGAQGIPAIYLIGPDGTIVADNLRGRDIFTRVGDALGGPAPQVDGP